MTVWPGIRSLGAVALLAAALLASACSRSDAPPATPATTLPGTPASIYDAILPEIRDRIARDTKIVRVDGAQGAIAMRFSAYLEDHSVRLVEVGLAAVADPMDHTEVTISSRRFSFLPGRSRDAQDATLERSVATLIEKRVAAARAPRT